VQERAEAVVEHSVALHLAQLYVGQGRIDAAQAEFEEVARRSPRPVAKLTTLGVLLQSQRNIDPARKRFEGALQIDPEAAVAANNLARIYSGTHGDLDAALQLALTAKRRLPDTVEVNDTLGRIYNKKGLPSLAVSTLKLSADKSPARAQYQYHLAPAYVSAGNQKRAALLLHQTLALEPNFDGAQDAREVLGSLGGR
jgi:tetratricopeptide (TPR) repeat protein